jgi:hypothetical protein
VVFGAPQLVLRIGRRNAALERLLAAAKVRTAAFVTPANPRSEKQPAAKNRRMLEAVRHLLAESGQRFLDAEGRDPRRRWPAERGVFLLGIARADAMALGRLLDQNAIVYVARGREPELIVLASPVRD